MRRPTAKAFVEDAEKIGEQFKRLLSTPDAEGFCEWLSRVYDPDRLAAATDRDMWIALGKREVARAIIRARRNLLSQVKE